MKKIKEINEIGEIQYQKDIKLVKKNGYEQLGLMTSWGWRDDPKRLVFTLARYKFVAKMFQGKERVLEIGCSDGFASRIVREAVGNLTAVDIDINFIECARELMSKKWPIDFRVANLLKEPIDGNYDAVYLMDVLEHIKKKDEDRFIKNITKALKKEGAMIVGMPSLESQKYASKQSKIGHVNCKTMTDFKKFMEKHFVNVFAFSMNDEVVHTGYHKMSHYLICLCVGKRS